MLTPIDNDTNPFIRFQEALRMLWDAALRAVTVSTSRGNDRPETPATGEGDA